MNRTTTVLAADVVGYSRLLAEDSASTIAALERLREQLIEPDLKARGGSILRTSGDGYLVEFPSVASAIDFSFKTQSDLLRHQAERPNLLTPDLRIGIHHGELNPDGREPHGEAITIAVRLQEIAQPGSVVISGVVHALLGSRGNRMFVALGERVLRNVPDPVDVWSWAHTGRATAATPARRNTSGRQILDRRVSDLIIDLHMRSARLAVSHAFDQLLATRPSDRPFALPEVFSVMGEKLNASRALLAPIQIALIDDHTEHLSDLIDEQNMNEYIRRVFNNSSTAFAIELLPQISAILESETTVLEKRRDFLNLVETFNDTRMTPLLKQMMKYAFIEIA